MIPSSLHLSILKTVFEAKPRTFSVPEIFWALNEKREHSLLINCLKALADLRESGLISLCDPPALTELGTMTLLGHVCGFAKVQQDSCGTVEGHGLKAADTEGHAEMGTSVEIPAKDRVGTQAPPAGIQLADSAPHSCGGRLRRTIGSAEESQFSAASAEFAGAGAGDSAHSGAFSIPTECAHDLRVSSGAVALKASVDSAGNMGLVDRENDAGSVPPKSSRKEHRDVPSSPVNLGRCAVTPQGNEQRSIGASYSEDEAPEHAQAFGFDDCVTCEKLTQHCMQHNICMECNDCLQCAAGSAALNPCAMCGEIQHQGTTIAELVRTVIGAEDRAKLFREMNAEMFAEYVCGNPDCLKVCTRLFSCDFCGECERRCSECLAEHEAAGHESDTTNAQHMYSGIRLVKP